jgi:phage-related minor tail protein
MADRIKGITVEIGGDTTNLNRALSDVNTESRNLQRELGDVQRLLRFDPENTELLAQRQQLLAQQVENTTDRLNRLRSVSAQVEQQYADGLIDERQFRGFQREIQATENRLERLQREMQDTGEESRNLKDVMKDAGAGMANALAGAVAGAGAAGIIQQALDVSSLDTTIDLSLQVPEEEKAAVKDAVRAVTAYGVDAESALDGVRRQWQLNAGLTAEENAKIVEGAAAINRAYQNIDFTELMQETHEMALGMEMTHEEALGMTKSLLDMGFPEDQLDIITEYGQQLTRAGYDATEIQNIFAAGIESGTWNIDVLLDGMKEGRIVAAEFGQGIDKATAAAIEGTKISADQLKNWGAAVSAGGDAGKKAMGEMAQAVLDIEDPIKRNEVGVKVFGTLWEENGEIVATSLAAANTGTADLKTNQDNLNASIDAMKADPQVRLNTALAELKKTLQPLLATVAEWVTKVADWITKNPELAAGIGVVVAGIGLLIAAGMALAPIFMILSAAAGAVGIGLLPLIGIILGIVAAIALITAGIIWLVKNWDMVSAKWKEGIDKINKAIEEWAAGVKKRFNEQVQAAKDMVAKIMQAFEDWKKGVRERFDKGIQDVKDLWNGLVKFFKDIDLKQIGKDIIQGLINGIGAMKDAVMKKAGELASSIGKKISGALKIGSPSKVTEKLGLQTGEGLAKGLFHSIGKVGEMSGRLAESVATSLQGNLEDSTSALTLYFDAIRQDGDWLNDWLTHMPADVANLARQMGKALAPSFEGADTAAEVRAAAQKALTVNLHSPKALDVRDAAKEFNRTLNKMSLMW